jgi:hypothetical protein
MAPNGYLVGKQIYIDIFRIHRRYAVKNGACTLQDISSDKTFCNEVIDVSEGGLKLVTKANPDAFKNVSEATYKILEHSIEESPIPLAKEFIKVVWQNNHIVGCTFVSSAP